VKHHALLFFSDKVDAGLVLPSTGTPQSHEQKLPKNRKNPTDLIDFEWVLKHVPVYEISSFSNF